MGTNRRLLWDLAAIGNLTQDRVKRFESAVISAEVLKRKDLMTCGVLITPEGPRLGPGLVAPTIDELDPIVVHKAVKSFVEQNFDPELQDIARVAGLLTEPKPARKPSAVKRGHVELEATQGVLRADDGDDDDDEDEEFDWTCDQVRRKITQFIESGEMKVTEFQKTIHANSNSYGRFMKLKGPWKGIDNSTMSGAYKFFKKREREGKAMPKKRKTATVAAAPTPDHPEPYLDGEENDSVEIYDSCDEIRRKISAHLRKPGVTQAQFLRDIAAQFKSTAVKIQSKQLNDFRAKSGADAGNTSRVFYGSYVYFEKLRLKEGKPKSKHRTEMEDIWGKTGGFDIKHTGGGSGRYAMPLSSFLSFEPGD